MAEIPFPANSRYAAEPLRKRIGSDGRRVVFVRPRPTPPPEAFQPGPPHQVVDSDRLDLIAWTSFGEPTAWWMLADANRATHPGEVLAEPGSNITLPVPGVPGAIR